MTAHRSVPSSVVLAVDFSRFSPQHETLMSEPTVPVAAPLSPEERSRLQRLAEEAREASGGRSWTKEIDTLHAFEAACSPSVVLSLLADAEDAEKWRALVEAFDPRATPTGGETR